MTPKIHYKRNDKQPSLFWKGIFGGFLTSMVILVSLVLLGINLDLYGNQNQVDARQNLSDFEATIIDTAAKAKDAVVSVDNYQVISGSGWMSGNMQGFWFGSDGGLNLEEFVREPQLVGSGSGVIYKIDGDKAYVVTNNHVVEGAEKLEIQMADGRKTEADLVGTDKLSDLAVLTIPADYAQSSLDLANSDEIQVGSLAIAIGSPVDSKFATSVTQGIISGLNRKVPVDTDGDKRPDWDMTLIQTDAAINPGNSGGALLNSQGQLIGINSSKLASSAIEGMGFAIPSNDVKMITSQLEEKGSVERPALGIQMVDLSNVSIDSRIGLLKLPEDQVEGTVVVRIMKQSSAETSGLREYDVIIALNEQDITDSMSLKQALYQYHVGDTISLKVIRDGHEETVEVELTEAMPNPMN